MTKRLIAVVDSSDADGPYKARARVYRDTEWDEWRVRYYHGDQLLSYMGEESDSFHGDQADAIGTAEQQVKSLAKQSVPGSRLENPASRGEVKPKSLDNFKALAKQHGYKVVKKNNARLGEFYIAEDESGDPVGSFCPKYPKDAYLLT